MYLWLDKNLKNQNFNGKYCQCMLKIINIYCDVYYVNKMTEFHKNVCN